MVWLDPGIQLSCAVDDRSGGVRRAVVNDDPPGRRHALAGQGFNQRGWIFLLVFGPSNRQVSVHTRNPYTTVPSTRVVHSGKRRHACETTWAGPLRTSEL